MSKTAGEREMPQTTDRYAARFAGDERGSIAVIFAVTAFIIFCVVGLAIDYGRTITVKNKLQRAADAAVMADLSTLGKTHSELRDGVEARLHANLPEDLKKVPFQLVVTKNGASMTLTMETKVKTSLMAIAGFNHLPVNIEAKASIAKRRRAGRPSSGNTLREALERSGGGASGAHDALKDIDMDALRGGDTRAAEELLRQVRSQLEAARASGRLDGMELPGGMELPANIFGGR